MVEQGAVNSQVVGSEPTIPAKIFGVTAHFRYFIMGLHVPRLAFLPCKERVEGSIPFGSTNIEILSYLAYMIQETIVVRDNEFVENEIWVGGDLK